MHTSTKNEVSFDQTLRFVVMGRCQRVCHRRYRLSNEKAAGVLPPLLPFVFGFRRLLSLPLHIGGVVCTAPLERLHMVDHIAWALSRTTSGRWTGVLALE